MFDPRTRKRPRKRLAQPNRSISRNQIFWAKLISATLSWAPFLILTNLIHPNQVKDWLLPNSYLIFFLLLFLSLSATLWILTSHLRRTLLVSGGIIFYFALRLLGVGQIWNAILITGLLLTFEIYLSIPTTPSPPEENV